MDRKPPAVFSPDDIVLIKRLLTLALSGMKGEWTDEQKKQMVLLHHRLGRIEDNA